jgi:hypothetical protein
MLSVLINNREELDSENMKAVAGSGLTEGKEEDRVFIMLSLAVYIDTGNEIMAVGAIKMSKVPGSNRIH